MNGRTKKIIINQKPVAQPRARITRFVSYDPSKDKKNWARIQIAEQIDETLECPIEMEVTFYLQIPKSISKKKRKLMLSNELKHQKLGDLDNFLKFLCDSMNELVFKDDKQVWKVKAQKLYSETPRTEIILRW